MTSTTIKVPVELRDRLAEHAREWDTTLASVIERSLEIADTTAFWDDVRATMGTPEARIESARDAEALSASLADGLEPEDWSDIL